MASIPSPIRKWVQRYITGEGSDEIASQSPVQSVNGNTGDVTVSASGGVIPSSQTVASYADLPTTDRSEAEIWFVTGENDIVASTQLSPAVWRSVSDFTIVAIPIPDSELPQTEHRWPVAEGSGTTWFDNVGSVNATANFENWESGTWIGGYISRFNASFNDEVESSATSFAGPMWMSVTVDIDSQRSEFQRIHVFNKDGTLLTGTRAITFNDSGQIRFAVVSDSDNSYQVFSSALSAGRYRIVAYVDPSNSEIGLAIDGSIVDTTDTGSDDFQTTVSNTHYIGHIKDGNDNGTDHFDGGIDDCGIGSAVPSTQDIQDDYDSMSWS